MPKKKTTKTAKAVKSSPKKVSTKKASKVAKVAKEMVGFRLRMSPSTHKQLVKMATKEGVSQNTLINNLIKETK